MFKSQKGRCFVCRRHPARVVDHDHKRRHVRALTCGVDNLIEGLLLRIGVRSLRQLEAWALRMYALRTVARW